MKKKQTLTIFDLDQEANTTIPFVDAVVKAGFPNIAQDYLEGAIDLNKALVKHPATTFLARVDGDSMIDARVHNGDLLVIDKSAEPRDGKMAVCYIDGEFTLKFIKIEKDVVWLVPANKDFEPIKVTAENELLIWGIVEYVISKPAAL